MRRAALMALLSLAVGVPCAVASGPLVTAVAVDPPLTAAHDGALTASRVRDAGAQMVRLFVSWRSIAPAGTTRPNGFTATDPDDPRYFWGDLDEQVRTAVAAGLSPLLSIADAPAWAERGSGGTAGTNRPDPAALAEFGSAVATRFSGARPGLPRVRHFQVWNEPNASFFMWPQRVGGRTVSVADYRAMVNATALAVHGVQPDAVVVAGGTFPNTIDRGATQAIGALKFLRDLTCMSRGRNPHRKCGSRVRFDAWSTHPYTSGAPGHHASNSDDVAIGDLGELRRLLDAAVDKGQVRSRVAVRLWVTEFGWDSDPPDSGGVPAAVLTRWTAEALYRMWTARVRVATWFRVRDDAPASSMYQSGLYARCASGVSCDVAKPNHAAFRFPFVAFPSGRGRARVWGRTPGSNAKRVVIERRRGSGWRRVTTIKADRFGIFRRRLRIPARASVRARIGSDASPDFAVRRTRDRPGTTPFGS